MEKADFAKLTDVFDGAAGKIQPVTHVHNTEIKMIRELIFAANETAEKHVYLSEGIYPGADLSAKPAVSGWTYYTGFQYGEKLCCIEFTSGRGLRFNDGDDRPSGKGEPCRDYAEARRKLGAWLKENAPEILQAMQKSSTAAPVRARSPGHAR